MSLVVLDDEPARRHAVVALVESLRCRATATAPDWDRPPGGLVGVAVAVAEENPPGFDGFRLLERCRHAGLFGVAYGPGATRWKLAARCRPLIAGAQVLLDATAATFAAEFDQAVRGALAARRELRAGEAELHERMRALGLDGRSPAILEAFRGVLRFAILSDLPVLITGETGTGKERFTRALHRHDPKRSAGPFVAVNCGALVPTLAESELFGHRRGAFTGAERSRPGLVRAASGGVLFLDEVGELDPSLQAKLLRVLQEGRVLGVGEEADVAVDVRVVAATHRDLHALAAAGRFRADLLHRLEVLPLHLPALRERRADIPEIVGSVLARQRGLHAAAALEPRPGFLAALGELEWPGNVRELENLLRRTLVNKRTAGPLDLGDLPPAVLAQLVARPAPPAAESTADGTEPRTESESLPATPAHAPLRREMPVAPPPADPWRSLAQRHHWNLARSLAECEHAVVAAAIAEARGNRTRAAQLLGVSTRSVYNLLHRPGPTPER